MNLFGPLQKHIQYVFAGKSALSLVLQYLHAQDTLLDKSAQVLVPEWLGTWVYMTMHNYCFPTTVMNEKVRAMLVYHQWGFPQRMEKIEAFARKHKLFLIEDCAHTIDSTYKGKRAGTFGNVSIWSLSKFFPTPVGGGIYTKDKKLRQFITRKYTHHNKQLEREALRGLRQGGAEVARAYAVYDRLTLCPVKARTTALLEYKNGAVEKRRQNFSVLRKSLWGKDEEKLLEDSKIVPWMTPLFCGAKNALTARALKREGFESGVYHFDVNRNMLKPRFVECVGLPCHQGLSERDIKRLIKVVRSARK